MQIVYHIGAHGTDQDRIIRTLLRNRDTLWKTGTDIPAPTRYRGVLGEAINALKGGEAPAQMQEMLLDSLLDNDSARRVILSQPGFLGMPARALSRAGLYAHGGDRVAALGNLFPSQEVEFFLGLLHPAMLVRRVIGLVQGGSYASLMAGIDLADLRWAPSVLRMVQAAGPRRMVIWSQEDLPFVWPELLRRMAGVGPDFELLGDTALLADLLPEDRMKRLAPELAACKGDTARRRAIVETALLEDGAGDKMEAELDLPDWTQDLVDEITERYREDCATIAALPGVEFLAP